MSDKDYLLSNIWCETKLGFMRPTAIQFSLVCASLLALAAIPSQSQELWQGFSAGMNKQQIISKLNKKVSCNEKEGTLEWCTTQPYLTLGNNQAKAMFRLENNKLIGITLRADVHTDSCPEFGSYSPDEIKKKKQLRKYLPATRPRVAKTYQTGFDNEIWQ